MRRSHVVDPRSRCAHHNACSIISCIQALCIQNSVGPVAQHRNCKLSKGSDLPACRCVRLHRLREDVLTQASESRLIRDALLSCACREEGIQNYRNGRRAGSAECTRGGLPARCSHKRLHLSAGAFAVFLPYQGLLQVARIRFWVVRIVCIYLCRQCTASRTRSAPWTSIHASLA